MSQVSPLITFCNWFGFLFLMNIYWMLMVILGGGIFGLFPATSALLLMLRRFINKDNKVGIKHFFIEWKKEFLVSNLVGLPIVLVMFSLAWYLLLAFESELQILQLVSLAIVPLLIFMMMFLSATVIQGSVFSSLVSQRWKLALGLLSHNLKLPFTLAVGSALCLMAGLFSPLIFLLFGISPAALLVMIWYVHCFPDLNRSS